MKDCTDKTACMGRREFLVKTGTVAGGLVLTVSSLGSNAFGAAFEDVTVPIGADSPLAKVGGSLVVDTSDPKVKVLVVRLEKSKFAAFSSRCTHKGTKLGYNAEAKQVECPNHGSRFDPVTGAVTRGPAEVALKSYAAKGSDESVTVAVAP